MADFIILRLPTEPTTIVDSPVSRIRLDPRRVASAGKGSCDATATQGPVRGEWQVEELVHVPPHEHVRIGQDDLFVLFHVPCSQLCPDLAEPSSCQDSRDARNAHSFHFDDLAAQLTDCLDGFRRARASNGHDDERIC